MTKLRLGPLEDDKPVKLSVELPAAVHRDLVAYAEILARSSGEAAPPDPAKLVAPMLLRFMATDKGFSKAKRAGTRALARPASRPAGIEHEMPLEKPSSSVLPSGASQKQPT